VDIDDAQRFAARWEANWNSHDLDRVLADYAEDVVFRSPFAATVVGTDTIVGKPALRAYWTAGLARLPDLHFTVTGVQVCLDTVVINYRNEAGRPVSEVLRLRDGLVVDGFGAYGPTPQ
jgi:ketosteroid isomerase-like protein